MPSNSLPDADLNLPEMKTKSPSCPAAGVHMYDNFDDKVGVIRNELIFLWILSMCKLRQITHSPFYSVCKWFAVVYTSIK